MPLVTEQPVTSSDKTFFQLRRDIVEGEVASGSKLSETELSNRYTVSRAVIREAINRLENCHLVERKANVGARVVALGRRPQVPEQAGVFVSCRRARTSNDEPVVCRTAE